MCVVWEQDQLQNNSGVVGGRTAVCVGVGVWGMNPEGVVVNCVHVYVVMCVHPGCCTGESCLAVTVTMVVVPYKVWCKCNCGLALRPCACVQQACRCVKCGAVAKTTV